MPLGNASDYVLKALSPITSSGVDPQGSLERQRLELMQQQFENLKQEQARQAAFQQLEEQGRNARAQMENQREQEKAAAAAKLAQDTAKRGAYAKFTELNGQGKYDEARAMLPEMNDLGMSAELVGETGGLPSYRVHMSPQEAQAAAQKQSGIGYPTNDSEPMQVAPGNPSTEDAFKQAQDATQHFDETGQPARGTDAPDFTGAVPNDVIDTGANAAAARYRASQLFPALARSMPGAYQESAQGASDAVLSGMGAGLPLKDAMDMYKAQQSEANPRIQSQLTEEGTNQRAAATQAGEAQRAGATRAAESYQLGNAMADKAAEPLDLKGYLGRRRQYSQALTALDSGTPADNAVAASSIIRLLGDNHISNADVDRVLGGDGLSAPEQVAAKLHSWVSGGMPKVKKDAIKKLLETAQAADEGHVDEYLNNAQNFIEDPGNDAQQRKGYEDSVKTLIPEDKRTEFMSKRNAEKQKGATGGQTFNMQQDLDTNGPPGAIQIPQSSRIAYENSNPGNLKFVGQPGAVKGAPAQDGGNWAKFSSPEEGLQALASQIRVDAKKGLTAQEFVYKYAPPGSNDTKTYLQQFLQATGSKPLDALSSIDPAKVLRFMAQKESGTVVPEGATFEAKNTTGGKYSAWGGILKKEGYL